MKQNEESSEEEDNDYGPKSDIQKIRDAFRNNTNPNQIKKTPSYESDTNGITADANLNNNTASGKALTNLKQPL